MKNRVLRAGGALSMLWSLVVLGAPSPLSECAMPAATPAMHAAMGHSASMAAHMHEGQPSTPQHQRAPGHSACCVTACGCGAFASLPTPPAIAAGVFASFTSPQPLVVEQTTGLRPPHSLPFAHAPPLS